MHPPDTRHAPRQRADHGASILEWLLCFLLALLLILVLVPFAPVIGSTISHHICRALHMAFGEDGETARELCGPEPDPPIAEPEEPAIPEPEELTDEDFEPPLCQVRSSTDGQGLHGGFFHFRSGDTSIARIEFADGNVWYIAEPWATGSGHQLGFGAAWALAPPAPIFLGLWGELEGHGIDAESYIWAFDDPAEAAQFEQALREETSIGSNAFSQFWNSAKDTVTGWFGADNSGYGFPEEPHMELAVTSGNYSLTAGPELVVGATFSAPEVVEVNGGWARTVRTDHRGDEPIISENLQVSGDVAVDGQVVLGQAGAGGGLGWSAGIRSDRTEDGELQGIYLNATYERESHGSVSNAIGFGFRRFFSVEPQASYEETLGSHVQQTHVYIEFDNDEERAIGEQFLRENSGYAGTTKYFVNTMFGNHAFLEEDPGPDDPWKKLLYDQAYAWQTTGSSNSISTSYGVNGQIGTFPIGFFVPGGVGWNSVSNVQSTEEAWYLGASQEGGPQETSTRGRVDYDECLGGPRGIWHPPLAGP